MCELLKNFELEREKILNKFESQNKSNQIPWSTNEQKASLIWDSLKKSVHDDPKINLLENLAKNLDIFKSTKLYQQIRKMPKGILQHAHLPASISLQGFLDVMTHDPRIKFSPVQRQFFLGPADKDITPSDAISITAYRQIRGDKAVDEEIASILIMNDHEKTDHNTEIIFSHFNKRFLKMGDPFFFQPIMSKFTEKVVQECQQDNIQGIELRNVCEFGFNEDFSKSTLKQELAFMKKMKQNAEKEGFMLNWIHTGIKEKDTPSDYIHRWTEIVKCAFNNEELKDVFCGFDMVDYEDNCHLFHIRKELIDLKKQFPDLNLILHAGESTSKSNKNILDAILMGSKRIGHGINIAFYPKLIQEIIAKNMCVEINMVSNFMLGFMRDLFWHPLRMLINEGANVAISSDDCLFWDVTPLTMDFFVATMYSDLTFREIKWMILNSIEYSYFNDEKKKLLVKSFEEKWTVFCCELMNLTSECEKKC